MRLSSAATFRSLQTYNYRVWAAGAIVSNIGTWMVVIGAAALMFTNTSNSLMQLSTEPAMRGRVMALRLALLLGARLLEHRSSAGWPTMPVRAGRWGVAAAAGFAAVLVGFYAREKLAVRTTDRSREAVDEFPLPEALERTSWWQEPPIERARTKF